MSLDMLQIALATPAPVTQEPNSIYTLLMFGGLFVFMYFLIIRPQRKRAKEHKELMEQLKMIGLVTLSVLGIIAILIGTIWYSRLPV